MQVSSALQYMLSNPKASDGTVPQPLLSTLQRASCCCGKNRAFTIPRNANEAK